MIRGVVTGGREAIIHLQIRGPEGRKHELDAVLDTGFTEMVSRPPSAIDALGLLWVETNEVILADDTVVQSDVYEAIVSWDGQDRPVIVHSLEGSPLLGMTMLQQHLLTMLIVDDGAVTIERAP